MTKFFSFLLISIFILTPLASLAQPQSNEQQWKQVLADPGSTHVLYHSFTSDAPEDAGKEVEIFVTRIESREEEKTFRNFVLAEIKDAKLVNPEADVTLMYLDKTLPKRAPGQENNETEEVDSPKKTAQKLADEAGVESDNVLDIGKDLPETEQALSPESYRRQNRVMALIRFTTNGAASSIGFLVSKEILLNTYECLTLGVITGSMSGFLQLKNKYVQTWLMTGTLTDKKTNLEKAQKVYAELLEQLKLAPDLETSEPIAENLKKTDIEIKKIERSIAMEELKKVGEQGRLRVLYNRSKEYFRWYALEVGFASVLVATKNTMLIGLANAPAYLASALGGDGVKLLSMIGTGGQILEASFISFLAQGFWDLSIAKETQTMKALKPWMATAIQNRGNRAALMVSMLSVLGLSLQIGEVPYAQTAMLVMGGTGLINYIRVEVKDRPTKLGAFIRNMENVGSKAVSGITEFGKKIVRGCKKLFSIFKP